MGKRTLRRNTGNTKKKIITNKKKRTKKRIKKTQKRIKYDGGNENDFKSVMLSVLKDNYIPFLPTSISVNDKGIRNNYLSSVCAFDLLSIIGNSDKYSNSKTITSIVKQIDSEDNDDLIKLLGNLTKLPLTNKVMSKFIINCSILRNNQHLKELREYILECEDYMSVKYTNWYKVALGLISLDDNFEGQILTEIKDRKIFIDTDKLKYGLNILYKDDSIKNMFKSRIIECGHKPQGFFDKLSGNISWDSYNKCFKCSDNKCIVYLDENYKAFLYKKHNIKSIDKIKILIYVDLRLRLFSKYISLECLRIINKKYNKVKNILNKIYKLDYKMNRLNNNELKQSIMNSIIGGSQNYNSDTENIFQQPGTVEENTDPNVFQQPGTSEENTDPNVFQQPGTSEENTDPNVFQQPGAEELYKPNISQNSDDTSNLVLQDYNKGVIQESTTNEQPLQDSGSVIQGNSTNVEGQSENSITTDSIQKEDKDEKDSTLNTIKSALTNMFSSDVDTSTNENSPEKKSSQEISSEIDTLNEIEQSGANQNPSVQTNQNPSVQTNQNPSELTTQNTLDSTTQNSNDILVDLNKTMDNIIIKPSNIIYLTFKDTKISHDIKELNDTRNSIATEIKSTLDTLLKTTDIKTINVISIRFGPSTTSVEIYINNTEEEKMKEDVIKSIIVDFIIRDTIKENLIISNLGTLEQIYFKGISSYKGLKSKPAINNRLIFDIPGIYPIIEADKISFEENIIKKIKEILNEPKLEIERIHLERIEDNNNKRVIVQFLIMDGYESSIKLDVLIKNFKDNYSKNKDDYLNIYGLKNVIFGEPTIKLNSYKGYESVEDKMKSTEDIDRNTLDELTKNYEGKYHRKIYNGCEIALDDIDKNMINSGTPFDDCESIIANYFNNQIN
jgi:hypothetical protein